MNIPRATARISLIIAVYATRRMDMAEEKNTTLDIQIQKNNEGESAMCLYITNQYDEAIPFYAVPIGGPPKYKYDLKVTLKPSIKN